MPTSSYPLVGADVVHFEFLGINHFRVDLPDPSAVLEERQQVSREIGLCKKEQGGEIVQPRRWEQLLESRLSLAREAGLDESAIKSIMEEVHRMSIQVQK